MPWNSINTFTRRTIDGIPDKVFSEKKFFEDFSEQ